MTGYHNIYMQLNQNAVTTETAQLSLILSTFDFYCDSECAAIW